MSLLKKIRSTHWTTSINLIIRGSTMVGKFILIYLLADTLTVEQNGIWGIFATSISLSLYVVGLDLYTYSTRRILDYPIAERSPMLRDQMVFYLISYAVLFPILAMLFVFDVIEWRFAIFLYAILVFEHLAQESYRTFVVFSRPILANIILFLRSGVWTYLLILLWALGFDEVKNLKAVYVFWLGGGVAAFILTLIFLSKFKFNAVRHIPINWGWIRQGIKVSALFFIGTVGYKIIEFADRYFIDFYHGKEEVGVYTFYASMCNMVETFVHTSVIILFSPKLIESFHRSNFAYRKTHAKFAKNVVLNTLIVSVVLLLVMIPLLRQIESQEYIRAYPTFIVLVLAKVALNFSLVFHYILYVRKNDFPIIKATVLAAIINILLNFILIPPMGVMGAALATLASFIIILLMKMYYSRNLPEAQQIIYLRFLRKKPKAPLNSQS